MSTIARKAILLAWALWFFLVALADVVNFLQQQPTQIIKPTFSFSSENYPLIVKSLSVYSVSNPTTALWLFGVVIIVAFIVGLAFLFALFINFERHNGPALFAFLLSFAFSAAFILWDEIFLQYPHEHTVMIRSSFQILTFILFLILGRPWLSQYAVKDIKYH